MTYDEWVRIGVEHQWAIPEVCYTHDGLPMTVEEQALYDVGYDPCVHIIRVCEPHQHRAIYRSLQDEFKWRGI